MKIQIALLLVLCFAATCVSTSAQVLYDNGPINGNVDAWTINFGFIVSDSFTIANDATMTGFAFGTRLLPGDQVISVDWSVTSGENSGTVYGSGTASGSQLTDKFVSTNDFGYEINLITATGLDVNLGGGTTYWLSLQNARSPAATRSIGTRTAGWAAGAITARVADARRWLPRIRWGRSRRSRSPSTAAAELRLSPAALCCWRREFLGWRACCGGEAVVSSSRLSDVSPTMWGHCIPQCKAVPDSRGNVYTTTAQGGKYGQGSVFEITP
jgi:hypothetical protein